MTWAQPEFYDQVDMIGSRSLSPELWSTGGFMMLAGRVEGVVGGGVRADPLYLTACSITMRLSRVCSNIPAVRGIE